MRKFREISLLQLVLDRGPISASEYWRFVEAEYILHTAKQAERKSLVQASACLTLEGERK